MAEKDFDYSKKVVAREYCTKTGLLAGDSCASKATGYYATNKLPGTCSGNCSASGSSDEEKTAD